MLFAGASAQEQKKEYPKPEGMRPGMTEFWTPQPKVVTPGDIKTNSAPSDAIVLFDGTNLSAWKSRGGGEAAWKVHDGVFTVDKSKGDIETKMHFGSMQLHIEWMVPENITGTGQGRGNSGVFLQGMYEVQILDCYNNETYSNGQTGSIYKQATPLANVMRKPGEWNTYDIIYSAGGRNIFDGQGSGWFMVSKEQIYAKQPQVIVIISAVPVETEEVYDAIVDSLDPVWKATPAYADGEVYVFSGNAGDILSRPGPRLAEATELLAKILNPEAFLDRDPLDAIPKYFADDYGFYLRYQVDYTLKDVGGGQEEEP